MVQFSQKKVVQVFLISRAYKAGPADHFQTDFAVYSS